jgi:hypothetical protein
MTQIVEQMAADLRNLKVDLGDERDVVRALLSLRYRQGDVIACMDEAIEIARRAPKNLSSIMVDSVVAIFAVGVWLAWYVVLCPAGT